MKKAFYFILSVILLAGACTPHPDCCTVANPAGGMTAVKNGAAWKPAFIQGSRSNTDVINFSAVSFLIKGDSAIKTDSLHIWIGDNDSKATYKLQSNQVFYATYTNGVATIYKLDDSYNNVLTVTNYDVLVNNATTNPNELDIKGTFDLKFIDPNNPAGISFTNGTFFSIMNQ